MASITIYPTANVSLNHSVVGGGAAYAALADNSDDTYIRYVATTEEESKTSTFKVGSSNSISGRYVITGITVVSRTKKGYNSMDTATAHSNIYVGGIEGNSWSLDLSTSWTNRSHTSQVSEFSNLNGKLLTSLPEIVLHLLSVTKIKTTGDNKYVGFSRSYITLTYDNYYSQTATGTTGVSASRSNSGTAVSGYYKSGTTTTYTATLSSGYGFKGWYTNSSGTGTAVSTNLSYSETCNSDRTLYAVAYTVSASGSTGVTASVSRDSDGRTFTFTASLSNNYAFDGWYNGSTKVSGDLSYSVTLSDSTELTAKAFSVSYSGDSHITVSASRSTDGKSYTFTGSFAAGTSTTVYTLNKWTVNGSASSESSTTLTVSITSNTTVTASSFTTTVAKDTGVSSVSVSRASATSVTATATLSNNYALDGWYNGNTRESQSLSYTKTISGDTTLTAKAFSVAYSGDSGISVSASRSSDGRSYTFTGTLVTESIYASVFDKWSLNGTTVTDASTLTYTKTIEQDSVIGASSYTITVAKGTGAESVSISRNSITSLTISCSMSIGYDFDGWYVNNTKRSSTSQTTLSSINASETYTANGVLHVYSLSVVEDQHSTGSITTDDYYYGTVATFTASPANKYLFDGFYNDQSFTSLYSSSNPATYTITDDKTLYIKTRPRKRIFNKVNGEWKIIDNVYVKINGIWVLLDQDELPNVFYSNVKYINRT